ncbi:MAG: hypothetical protein K0S30_824, partial [Clostridia bacterium]|nr:hypothetical protein [Clostridia bacterium]
MRYYNHQSIHAFGVSYEASAG